MAIENLTPENRVESLLSGADLKPATRLEYFLAKAAEGGGGGGSVYSPVLAQTTKSVSNHWVSSFSGGPILEGASYRVIVNGTTYEPLTGTAGEDGYICLGNTYVADSDPTGDYSFGIFYKNNQLSAWLETGDSMTMQIDQIIQAVPVPTPAAADTGKVLTANNGDVEWNPRYMFVDTTLSGTIYTCNKTFGEIYEAFTKGLPVFVKFTGGVFNNNIGIVWTIRNDANQNPPCYLATTIGDYFDASGDSTDYPQFNYD